MLYHLHYIHENLWHTAGHFWLFREISPIREIRVSLFYGSSAESVGEMQPVDLTGWCPALGKPRVFHSPTGPTNADPF